MRFKTFFLLCAFAPLWFNSGCNRQSQKADDGTRVTLYCSVDEVYAKPILARIEKRTGLKIDAVFDTEATKTAGLSSKIVAERARPQADVFWSSATLQVLRLTDNGLVQPYVSEATRDVPAGFKSAGGIWTSNGVRAHVIIYNAKQFRLLGLKAPNALDDLKAPRLQNRVGFSNPSFGTSSDWVTALALRRGTRQILDYVTALKRNGARVLPGNYDVARAVGAGQLAAGLTDTDDFLAARKQFPDLRLASPGPKFLSNVREEMVSETVYVPMPIVQIANNPHPKAAAKLIDALASRQTEQELVDAMPGVLPIRVALPERSRDLKPYFDASKTAPDDYSKWPDLWRDVQEPIADALQ